LCDGRPVQLAVVRQATMIRSQSMLGETLAFTTTRLGCQDGVTHFSIHVAEMASGREVTLMDLHAAADC
jgi:hypothetical protein